MSRWWHVPSMVLVLAAGCSGPAPTEIQTSDDSEAVRTEASAGAVQMTVTVSDADVMVGAPIVLSIEVVAPEEIDVELPEIAESLGDFAVRAARTPPDVPEPGQRRWTHTYTLDSFAAGTLEVPALTVRVAAAGDAGPAEVTTEPLVVTVRSALAADEEGPRDLKGEVGVPIGEARRSMGIAAGIMTAIVFALLAFMLWRRRGGSAGRPVPVVPPHVWAMQALGELEVGGLVEEGRVHEFYVRLSDIVRQYIERRFHIMAPEQTTEEFLRATGRHTLLAEEHRTRLATFLRAADLVKFARYEPTLVESNDALGSARAFVTETTPAATPPAARSEEPVVAETVR